MSFSGPWATAREALLQSLSARNQDSRPPIFSGLIRRRSTPQKLPRISATNGDIRLLTRPRSTGYFLRRPLHAPSRHEYRTFRFSQAFSSLSYTHARFLRERASAHFHRLS